MTTNIMRDIDPELVKWKESWSRRPLLVRGARQVGKTYSIIEFAKVEFENHVAVNEEINMVQTSMGKTGGERRGSDLHI